MTEREAFGEELRRARERRGLTLDAIAEQTKVSAGHFAGLERGDLSRWPSGIFRRGFVRSYALAIGLNPEDSVLRFCRLFPDPSDEPAPGAGAGSSLPEPTQSAAQEPGSRLLLEQPPPARPDFVPVARRSLAGLLDVSIAVMPAALVALAAGAQWFWPVAAGIALAGHLACYASLGTTPGAWVMGRFAAPPAAVTGVRVERRRTESETPPAPRRRAARHAGSRPAAHVHRVRH